MKSGNIRACAKHIQVISVRSLYEIVRHIHIINSVSWMFLQMFRKDLITKASDFAMYI